MCFLGRKELPGCRCNTECFSPKWTLDDEFNALKLFYDAVVVLVIEVEILVQSTYPSTVSPHISG